MNYVEWRAAGVPNMSQDRREDEWGRAGVVLDEFSSHAVAALMAGYRERWGDDPWRAVAVEQEFCLPIINPAAAKLSASRTFSYAGKIDLIVENTSEPGRYWLCDHKTTSEDIEDPAGEFWRRMHLATQASHYQLACLQAGVRLEGCVWDVIRKPSIRPRRITKAERDEIGNLGTYQGLRLPEGLSVDQALASESEPPALYGLRVLASVLADPAKHYARRLVPRSDRELVEYAGDLWNTATLVRRSHSDGWFPRTGATHACFQYKRSCEYLDICCGFDSKESPSYVKRSYQHEELADAGESSNGLQVVTNSSLTTYRQCQRKYQFRYVDRIASIREKADALAFGSAMHDALERYWRQRMAPPERQLSRLFHSSEVQNEFSFND